MSRRFTYSAILVVALTLIAAAGILYARGTGGYESASAHKSKISHEAAPPTIDPRVARQMPLADASSQMYELWQREGLEGFTRHSPDRTTFPGYSSRRDAANYNPAFQGRQMRPDSLKSLLPWTNHRPAKRKISKPLVYDQVSSLGSPFALYDPVTVINPDAPKVD